MEKAFGTPRQPVLNSQPKLADLGKGAPTGGGVGAAAQRIIAKTPFQANNNNAYQRSFKSELQPNRVSSRFGLAAGEPVGASVIGATAGAKTGAMRFHTAHRPITVGRLGAATGGKPSRAGDMTLAGHQNPLTARLRNFISNKQVPVIQHQQKQQQHNQQQHQQLHQQNQHQQQQQVTRVANVGGLTKPPDSFARGAATPGASLRPAPAPQVAAALPSSTRPFESLARSVATPNAAANQLQPSIAGPPPTSVPSHHHSAANAATSEPARTHCHTSNRTNHQISRTQSEPSITYQVQVNDKTYKILRKIGSGGSSKVYEGFDPRTSQTVAIKIINVAQADHRARESYFNEKDLLLKLRDSRHVVDIYESEYKTKHHELIIVMEKGDADLAQVIDSYFKKRDVTIDGIFIKFYWRGILQAVNSIHQHGIVHADLKPVNFILVKNEIKLIDFGIANAIAPEGTSVIRDYQIGTINFMAPEALKNRACDISFTRDNNNQHHLSGAGGDYHDDDENKPQHKRTVIKYNSKADIWSLGCILYNLIYGRPPFDKYKDIISKSQAITDPQHVIHFPQISNPRLLNCLKACLRYNPADRPSAQDLLNDPYLKEDVVVLERTPSSQRNLRIG